MEEESISKSALAERLNRSTGRVSQVYNNPGNLSLRVIVEHAQALGMKAAIVAYDDGDPENYSGPISPNVFVRSWEALGMPRDLFEVAEAGARWVANSSKEPHKRYDGQYVVFSEYETLWVLPEPLSLLGEFQDVLAPIVKGTAALQQPAKSLPQLAWFNQEFKEPERKAL